ncbi:Hypothetical protein, putative [Bodo saltans]|uniref:Uncharacterized protein n=1 Tax=Bodo saltans TaxID=75058 RepID=A0A0S4JFM1_BODSA|nr:Hypothetical protein, putative [Bodo saltans]|eukprot:CUG88944.1 Hypothetical protein, putative [Bodo saltans]
MTSETSSLGSFPTPTVVGNNSNRVAAERSSYAAVNVVPLSFADLLSSRASDIIDWAPPGRVSSLHDQTHTAARSSPTSTTSGNLSSSAPVAMAPKLSDSSWWWTQGVMNGLFSAQSHTDVLIRETGRYRWTGGVTSALGVTGPQPLSLDAGWRVSSDTVWSSVTRRFTAEGQWGAVPLALWPKNLQARYQSSRVDGVVRADQKFYSLNICGNILVPRQQDAFGSEPLQSSSGANSLTTSSPAPTPAKTSSSAASAGVLLRAVNEWSSRYLSRLRAGVGLTIKNDLATGINLFAGAAFDTSGGLSASYHIDVLRRVTISVAQHQRRRSTTVGSSSQDGEAVLSSSSSSHQQSSGGPTYACRLKLNAITYEGTVMEWGASIPVDYLVPTVLSGYSQICDAYDISSNSNNVGTTSGRLGAAAARAGMWLRRQPITVQCSHSGVGAMIGFRWCNVEQYLPERLGGGGGGGSSDFRVDITAGVVAKRRGAPASTSTVVAAAASSPSEVQSSLSSSPPSGTNKLLSSTQSAPSSPSRASNPRSTTAVVVVAANDDSLTGEQTTTVSSSVMSEKRFHSANSTVVLDSGDNLFPSSSNGGRPMATATATKNEHRQWSVGRLRDSIVPRDVSLACKKNQRKLI